MDRYAVVRNEDGYVINVSLWDGVTPWDPGEGYTAVKSDVAEIGDTYKDGEFIKPPAPEPVAEPTPQEQLAALQAQLAELAAKVS